MKILHSKSICRCTEVKKVLRFSRYYWPEIGLLLIFCVVVSLKINDDLWNDEIYTLKHFTFVPLRITLWDYHAPNNHIFFNLINNIYFKLIGVEDFKTVLQHPWLARIPSAIYFFGTIFIGYRFSCKQFSREVGVVFALLLLVNLAYFNFAFQVRAYGISGLLLLFLCVKIIEYLQRPKKINLFVLVGVTFLVFYSVPSNSLFLGGILTFAFVSWLQALLKRNHEATSRFKLLISLITGVLLTFLMLSPIFQEVFNNEFTSTGIPFQNGYWKYFLFTPIKTGVNGLSWLWLIVPLYFAVDKVSNTSFYRLSAFWVCMIVIGSLLPYVFGLRPPSRAYVVLIPISCLVVSASVIGVLRYLNREKLIMPIAGVFMTGYAVLFLYLKQQNAEQLLTEIETKGRSQSIYIQYFTDYYWPNRAVQEFKSRYVKHPMPVVILGCEEHGITYFLTAYGIPNVYQENHDWTKVVNAYTNQNGVYVISNHPNRGQQIQGFKRKLLSSRPSYHNVIAYYKR